MNSTDNVLARAKKAAGEAQANQMFFAPEIHVTKTANAKINRVERLLGQLEGASMALVPYGYWDRPKVAVDKSNTRLIVGAVVVVWLSTLMLVIIYFHRDDSPRATVTTSLVMPAGINNTRHQKVASSLDNVARAYATESKRFRQIEDNIESSSRNLRRFARKVSTGTTQPMPINHKSKPIGKLSQAVVDGPVKAAPSVESLGEEQTALSSVALIPAPLAAQIAESSPTNSPYSVLETKWAEIATPHQGIDGNIDYWQVTIGPHGLPEEVAPLRFALEGVVVHSGRDGRTYVLTPQGVWCNYDDKKAVQRPGPPTQR